MTPLFASMISSISFLLLHEFIQAAPTTKVPDTPVDLKLEVIIPVCLVAILVIVALGVCYYFYNKEDFTYTQYQILPEEHSPDSGPLPSLAKYKGFKNPVGLYNVKHECYMNCIIQAIASSNKFVSEFLEIQSIFPNSRKLNKLLELIDGVNNKNEPSTVFVNTALLKSLNDEIGWKKSSQQDSFDFLSALMNAIHKDMKEAKVMINLPLKFELFHKLIGFNLNDKVQYHLGLSVGLSGNYQRAPGVYLKELIIEHLAPTKIDEDSSKTTQMYFYKTAPEILTIHIQANKWDPIQEEMVKPEYHIQYENVLEFDTMIIKDMEKEVKSEETVTYKLMALVHHMGDYSSGHYVTYRNFRNRWFLVNDEQVEICEFDCKICPYIMIYEKV